MRILLAVSVILIAFPAISCMEPPVEIFLDKAKSSIELEAYAQVIVLYSKSPSLKLTSSNEHFSYQLTKEKHKNYYRYLLIAAKIPAQMKISVVSGNKSVTISATMAERDYESDRDRPRGKVLQEVPQGGCGSAVKKLDYK